MMTIGLYTESKMDSISPRKSAVEPKNTNQPIRNQGAEYPTGDANNALEGMWMFPTLLLAESSRQAPANFGRSHGSSLRRNFAIYLRV
jgi:hypothetical protein